MDINDKNPIFTHLPYEFEISEGKTDAYVGTVKVIKYYFYLARFECHNSKLWTLYDWVFKAVDDDVNENAMVIYSVPESSAFGIHEDTGEIFTKRALDYESEKVRGQNHQVNNH